MKDSVDLQTLMSNHGVEVIGAAQRVIAYSAVASGGTGLLNITAAGHGLKKNQTIYIGAGAYQGTYRILKVVSSSVIQVAGTFGSTTSGNINLTASLNGQGFIADSAPTIAEFEPVDSTIDAAAVIAKTYVAGQEVNIPYKKIRISAGNITCVRRTPQGDLAYSNR